MTPITKLLEDKTALADYLDRRLTCVCDDQLQELASGAALMQTLVNLYHLSATIERSIQNLAHTVIVQPEFVQNDGSPVELGVRRSVELYRLIVNGSFDAAQCSTRTALMRQQTARAFMMQAAESMGFTDTIIAPTASAIKLALAVEQMLSPGRPMNEQEFFEALGFCLAWTNFCKVQFTCLEKFLTSKCPSLVADLQHSNVKTFFGSVSAFSWITNTIEGSEERFAAMTSAARLLLDYYVGATDVDILCFWLIEGVKAFDLVECSPA